MYLLLLCGLFASVHTHQIFNYTWQIINEAGDVALSTSSLAATTPWPTFTVDLCRLAAGASSAWGLPDSYLPLSEAPQVDGQATEFAGCNSARRRTRLRESDFYVCPGGHRNRNLNYKCGFRESFFCASWGCETTGDAYWHPSSSWDYIFVKKGWNNTGPKWWGTTANPVCAKENATKGWCTPLLVTFTNKGKQAPLEGWLRGHEWGLRAYISGPDPGLIFKIKLTKEVPNTERKIILGQNKALYPAPPRSGSKKTLAPTPPAPPRAKSTSTPIPANRSSSSTPFQAILPSVGPSVGNTLVSLANATAQSLANSSFETCWICFSPIPPFYEGIAVKASDIIYTNRSELTRWINLPRSSASPGQTLSQLTGIGTCVHGANLLLPPELTPICNLSLVPDTSHQFMVAPNGTYFACSFGITPSIVPTLLIQNHEYCVIVMLVPRISIRLPSDLLPLDDPASQVKRDPVAAITLAVLLGLSATGAGTDIASIVNTRQQLFTLSLAIDKDIQALQEGLNNLKKSLISLSEVVLQNRRGLDLLFLKDGGLCAALKEECCFYKDRTGLVQDSIDKVRKSLEARQKQREKDEAWYKNWFSTSPLFSTLLPSLLGPFIGLLLLLTFGPWAFRRITDLIKRHVDSALSKGPMVYYQRITMTEPSEKVGTALNFSTLVQEGPRPWYNRFGWW